jgi:uncharacterized HAD superfamily protein
MRKYKKIILLDIDGVMSDTSAAISEFYTKRGMVWDYKWKSPLFEKSGALSDPNFFSSLYPIKSSVDFVDKWKADYKFIYATTRQVPYETTLDWFHKYNIYYDALYQVKNTKVKYEISNKFNCLFFIDDYPEHYPELRGNRVVYSQPYNKQTNCVRINKLSDLESIFLT